MSTIKTTKSATKKSRKTTPSATATPANPSPKPPAANPSPSPAPATITTIATASDSTTKLSQQAAYSAVVAGLLANYQPTDTFLVESELYTRDEAVAELNRFITAAEETKTNNQAWLASVQNERQVLSEVAPFKTGMCAIIIARYGKTSPQLRQYGLPPQKPRKVKVDTKSAALAKGKATRTARGTMSKKERQSIKAAPATPSPAPVATVTPAPAAPEAAPVANAAATPVAPAPAAK
jgi:hypothetical protein